MVGLAGRNRRTALFAAGLLIASIVSIGGASWASTAVVFSTKAAAAATSIASDVDVINLTGYSAPGDSPGYWVRSTGSSPCGFQTADGQWWQLKVAAAVSVKQCGAVCDGTTDDTTAIRNAMMAANGLTLEYPPGAQCGVSGPIDYCNAATCADGVSGGRYPILTYGNGATLVVLPAGSGIQKALYVENNNSLSPGYIRIRIQDLNVNANGYAKYGLQVSGCGYCSFVNINEAGATAAGCSFEGYPNFGLYYTLIERVSCNNNNPTSGSTGNGVQEYSYTAGGFYGGGSVGCSGGNAYNNSNAFIAVSAVNNGFRGFDINCAHNTHLAPDAEANLGTGFVFSNIIGTVEMFGGYSEGNACGRCSTGVVGGDTTAFNVTTSSGIYFFGGIHQGQFIGLTATNGDIVNVKNAAGFGFIANCGGKACVGIP
jgi:hypothetical protein